MLHEDPVLYTGLSCCLRLQDASCYFCWLLCSSGLGDRARRGTWEAERLAEGVSGWLNSRVFARQEGNEDPHLCSCRKHRSWLITGQRLELALPSSPCNRDKLRTEVFKATTEEATEDTMSSEGGYNQSRRPHPGVF